MSDQIKKTEMYHLVTVHLITDVLVASLRNIHVTREQINRRIKDRALKFVHAHFEDDDIVYGPGDVNVLETDTVPIRLAKETAAVSNNLCDTETVGLGEFYVISVIQSNILRTKLKICLITKSDSHNKNSRVYHNEYDYSIIYIYVLTFSSSSSSSS